MAEKDLANDMQQKEINQKLRDKIRKIEDEIKLEKGTDNINVKYYEKCELTIGGKQIEVSIAEVEEKKESKHIPDQTEEIGENEEENGIVKTYNIYFNDMKIAEINEEGKLIIDEEGLEKVDPKNMLGLKELGENEKPDISQINEIEGKTSGELAELDERDLEETGEQSLEELEEEISEEEKPEDEKLDDLMEIEARQAGISKEELQSNMIEIDLDGKKVTRNNNFREVAKIDKNITRAWAVPRKRCI